MIERTPGVTRLLDRPKPGTGRAGNGARRIGGSICADYGGWTRGAGEIDVAPRAGRIVEGIASERSGTFIRLDAIRAAHQ
jgi:hypothetical protein